MGFLIAYWRRGGAGEEELGLPVPWQVPADRTGSATATVHSGHTEGKILRAQQLTCQHALDLSPDRTLSDNDMARTLLS